jgi:hypothetical protein
MTRPNITLCLSVAILSSVSCAEIQHRACVDRLSEHFAAGTSVMKGKAANLTEYRTRLAQMQDLVESVDPVGCNSQTVFALNELRAGISDLQAAATDGQVLVHGLFSLFNAGDSSPASQQGKAAGTRVEAAIKLLRDAGVQGLD